MVVPERMAHKKNKGSMELKSEQATAASGATGQLEGLREVGPEVIQWGKQSGAGVLDNWVPSRKGPQHPPVVQGGK